MIDWIYHDSVSYINDWWGTSSYHYIGVPRVDSAAYGARYIFNNWSDGRDTVHLVGPIDHDTTFTANYSSQIMAVLAKNPVHTTGWLKVDSVLYWDSSYVYDRILSPTDTFRSRSLVKWWTPGFRHLIEASASDSGIGAADTSRFFWTTWSDLGARQHWTDTVRTPSFFIANYDSRLRVRLRKSPAETYGYFVFNDTSSASLIRGYSQFDFWAKPDSSVKIGVSEYDIDTVGAGADSVYAWNRWDDGGAIIHTIGPITRPTERIAYYNASNANLAIILAPSDPYAWSLGTVDPGATVAMAGVDSVNVFNIGNVPCDLGLLVANISPTGWTCGFLHGVNKFAIYAEFNDNTVPPVTYSPAGDYLKTSVTWSNGTTFGHGGLNILPPPHTGITCKEHIWLEFIAPTSTTVFDEVRITVTVVAKYHMP